MSTLLLQLRRMIFYGLAVVLALAALVYVGDYLSLRFRIPNTRGQFGTVTVTPYYAVHEKNNKIEYDFAEPQNRTCVHSLFPHFGSPACWYLSRHKEEKIEI